MIVNAGNGHNTILLKNSEVSDCIKKYYTKYKGSGARKLHRLISKVFTGVTEREIQLYINSILKAQRLNPKFINSFPEASGEFRCDESSTN